jgi:hypothetical protein
VGPYTERPDARYFYFAPEVRVGHRFAERWELSAGVAVLVLKSLRQPRWSDEAGVPGATTPPFFGGFNGPGAQPTLAGDVLVVIAPGVGVRFEL